MAVKPEELLTHAGFVAALARRLVSDEHAGADVAQQTFLAAIEQPPSEGKPLKSWLSRVARNLSIKQRLAETRRRKRERAYAVPERAPSASEVIEREEIRRKVVDAVLGLEEPYRSTLLMRYFEDLDAAAIAERLGCSASTVRNRHRRALVLLRDALDEDYEMVERPGPDTMRLRFALTEASGSIVVLNTIARHGDSPGYRNCGSNRQMSDWRMAVQTNALSARVAELACERHLPLIDVRHAMDSAVNLGLGSDGVHPSYYRRGAGVMDAKGLRCGYNVRNYVTMRMLAQIVDLVMKEA